jgi:hypothetical protein
VGNTLRRRLRRCAVTTMIAIIPTAIVATMATNLLTPTEKPTASYQIVETASIVNSPTTIGFADSDLVALAGPDYSLDDAEKAQVDATLDAMQALGVNTVRMGIPWAYIEPVPTGTPFSPCPCWGPTDYIIQQANARGMSVLGDITATPLLWGQNPETPGGLPYSAAPDPVAYSAFVSAVAQRYAGQVSAYEIWNEPNSTFGWTPQPDASAYTELLKAAYPAIKAADPNALVVAGVLVAGVFTSPLTVNPVDYVSTMYADGAKGYFDALSIHPYQYQVQFSQGAGVPYSPLTQLIAIRQLMIDNGDAALRIWATEYGLPTAGPNGVSEETQAAFIEDFLKNWAEIGYAGPAFIYTTRDQPGAENTDQGSFGVYTSDWQLKLAATVICQMTGGPACTPSTNPDPIGAALNAILQQLANAVSQVFAAAAQQFVQAAVTAVATALIQAITDALGGLFAGLAVTPAQQESIVEGVNEARMSISSLKVEPDASDATSLADVEGSETLGAKAADEGLEKDGAPVSKDETATEDEETQDATDTESDAVTGDTTDTDKSGDTTDTDKAGDTTDTDKSGDKTDTDKSGDKTDTDKAGDKTDTDKAGDKTDTDKAGDKTDTDKAGDKTDTDKAGDKTDTDKSGDKTGDKTDTDKAGDKTDTDKSGDKTGDKTDDKSPKSDPPVKKTDPPRLGNGNPRADGTDGNSNSATNAEPTSFSSPETKKALGSGSGTVWASAAVAG